MRTNRRAMTEHPTRCGKVHVVANITEYDKAYRYKNQYWTACGKMLYGRAVRRTDKRLVTCLNCLKQLKPNQRKKVGHPMSILSDLGLEDIPDGLADGVYRGYVYDAKFVNTNEGAKRSMVFTYRVSDHPDNPGQGKFKGSDIDQWQSANAFDEDAKKKWLKLTLESLGVPPSRFGSFAFSDIIGEEVIFTVKTKNGYTNVTSVKLATPSTLSSANGGSVQAAPVTAAAAMDAPAPVAAGQSVSVADL